MTRSWKDVKADKVRRDEAKSQLESGAVGQMEVDTLSRYVVALGGRLRLVADFDDHDVNVSTSEVDRDAVRCS